MVDYKLFILGGRSGTTLMQKLIMLSGEFRNWHRKNTNFDIRRKNDKRSFMKKPTQTPYKNAWTIYKNYPNVPNDILDPMDNFTLAKLPEFDLIIDMIIRRYKTPKFLILERDLESITQSYVKTFNRNISEKIFKYNGCKVECKKLMGDYPRENDYDGKKLWWNWLITTRERDINDYEEKYQENVLRIEFDDFMNKFNITMRRVSKFLGIKPMMKLWRKMRRIKSVPTKTNVKNYL